MGVYIALLFIPMMIQHTRIKGYYISHEKKNSAALMFFFLVLTALVMLRHESIGNDTRNYIYYFYMFADMEWEEIIKETPEIGFAYFNKIIAKLTNNKQIFLAIAAITPSLMMYPTYKRLCIDASLTSILYCTMSTFVMMFSGLRQMLSIGIGFIAYKFVREKKVIPFVAIVCLATAFHTSGFMLIFMYPIYHAKITKKRLYVIVPALAIIFVFNRPIFSVLSIILERYTKYDGSISPTGAYSMLILFAIFTAFAFIIPDESLIDAETIGLRNFLIFALVIQMFVPLHGLAMRMNYYYIIFIPLLLPMIIDKRKRKWNQVAILGRHMMIFVLCVYFFINASRGFNLNVFPYHFFWENI